MGRYYKDDDEGLKSYIRELNNAPFDLSEDHMMRGNLIRLGEEEYILVVTMHHIASDAWSRSVIVREFAELYNSYVEDRPAELDSIKYTVCRLCDLAKKLFTGRGF